MARDHSVDTSVVEFVRVGQKVSLNFTVGIRNRATFQAVMAEALGGNNFDPSRVASTIGSLFDDAMRVDFGAEGTAVLYLDVPYFENQRIGCSAASTNTRFTDSERQAYAQRVIDWAREMRADEITVQQHPITPAPVVGKPGDNPYRIRIWWD
ncbi:hypothetical protein [Alloactinosynnema sp. L-07]|uniref:hypothetical protein n=1 Tax=Alloactinosynnema sp. L-07 TaxID=1653480 RepID=UPI00065EF947|nr:hypothetical protein [Alloactinosynnema sp. L-07]CRK56935.1 hypothetical protein [Alloactinosynnema sp. L-07]